MNQNIKANMLSNLLGKIVSLFFPIKKTEIKKYLPTAMMMFIILFNYNVVRTLKDALIIADRISGAEAVNFLKTFVVLPASIIFVLLYSKISNMFSKTNVFYVCIAPFIVFNIVFTYILYPNVGSLHPSAESIQALKLAYPKLRSVFPAYGLWTYSLYYTFSELWGTVGMTLLFWQFANRIVKSEESKRFYPSFGLVGNIGFTIASFMVMNVVSSPSSFAQNFTYIMNVVIILSLVLVAIYWGINKYVLTDEDIDCNINKPKKKKVKPSLVESFKIIFSSKYLGCIMLLIFSYNSMINLVEVTWKSQVKAYTFSNDAEAARSGYTALIAKTNAYTGSVSILLFATANFLLSRFKWAVSASITPIIMVSTSILFFLFTVFPKFAGPLTSMLSVTPLFLAVIMGAIQNVASKSTKYSLFDPTKEMTYIPLDSELKSKGKAAVDIAGSRISKSFGGLVQLFLLFVTGGSQLDIAPYLMIFIVTIGVIWFVAIKLLSKQYDEALKSDKCE
ncbi:Npt1/Npt2 family nucleotide transporter [Candidatus Cytomitobacter primus]|uniref:ADP,ATP carrier protein n=1 Tax=Candidatus Cytomitobacter primus TaxID=2066024 RepID=A0A5C0UF96_9PROT|nr:Npt1/Npt2 family nucleotide transporter [Candidatus Cytomitobacter primus]QEK38776.1 NTP/NDP exchange transporter [Candidatus Cytomitobacter primus]